MTDPQINFDRLRRDNKMRRQSSPLTHGQRRNRRRDYLLIFWGAFCGVTVSRLWEYFPW